LKAFYAPIKAVEGHAGHPATDPQVLLALWLYATTEGVGSARQLDRLCAEHDAYRWLRGGVPVNYHTLADFRVGHQEALNELFTNVLGSMMGEGLVSLRHVAQDGIRIRASAGGSSFRRKERLEKCLKEARAEVERLALEREHPDPGVSRRERAARERAARERQERVPVPVTMHRAQVEAALRRLPEVEASKERQRKTKPVAERGKIKEARTSTTDAEATVMRMPGGGSQPGFNGELASDVDSQVIVGVGVVTKGTDGGQAAPMAEQIEERTGERPDGYLMDGGFVARPDITTLEKKGITVYAPSRPPRTETSGRSQGDPRRGDTPEVVMWRERMETEEAKKTYKERAATAECVNAHVRRYGLRQLVVRGAAKVLSVLLLVALTHNILRWVALTN
jgi:transposase